jgi:hypothetical protein
MRRERAVCDRCDAIDRELANFQRLRPSIKDVFALALIAAVVKDLEAERDALHYNDARKSGP